MLAAVARHGNGGKDWLEPACGTGRHLAHLGRLGYRLTGYDVSRRALAFARKRCGAELTRASMTEFLRPHAFDAAYSVIGTFRHLLTERDALRHLSLTRRSLRPSGVYVIGLDLVDYADCPPDEDGWEVVHRGRKLQHLYQTLPPERRRRKERVINFITAGRKVLQDEYDLRSYDLRQWRALVRKAGYRLAGAYTAEGKPLKLSRFTRYALFALRPRARGRSA